MRKIRMVLMVYVIVILATLPTLAETWRVGGGIWYQDATGTYYKYDDGSHPSDQYVEGPDMWFFVNDEGYVIWDTKEGIAYEDAKSQLTSGKFASSTWKEVRSLWFRTSENGSLLKNTWFQDVDGKWYYFSTGGVMQTDTTTPDGCYVGVDGVWVQ